MVQLARKERRRRRWIPKKNKIFIIQLFNGAASHKDTRRGEFRSHGATPSLSHTFMVLDSSTFRVENMDQPTRAPASSTKQLTTCHSNTTRCLVKGNFDLQGKLLDSHIYYRYQVYLGIARGGNCVFIFFGVKI